jgi:tRNA1(Val) A37 N6-methylase TrmN6
MFVKYIVKRGDEAIVIKFDMRNTRIQIGGYSRFIELLNILVHPPYFSKIEMENTHSQRNKIRYEGSMNLSDFLKMMDKVSSDFDCEKVKRVNRLI